MLHFQFSFLNSAANISFNLAFSYHYYSLTISFSHQVIDLNRHDGYVVVNDYHYLDSYL